MPDYTPILQEARKAQQRASRVLHVATKEPFRCWSGAFDFRSTIDDELDPGQVYSGEGEWLEAPPMRTMLNGAASGGALTFADVDRVREWLNDAGAGIIGARVYLGRVYLGADWQPLAPIVWTWPLIAGQPSVTGKGTNRVIKLNVMPETVDRSRARTRYWTRAGHRARHPGDSLLDLRNRYNSVYRIKWD